MSSTTFSNDRHTGDTTDMIGCYPLMHIKFNNMMLQTASPTLTVPGRKVQSVLKISEITHLEASSNYTFIHHLEKTFLASKTLRFYHEQLRDDTFIRTHQSYSVNINYINSIDFSNSIIMLNDGIEVPISRSRKRQLKDFFKTKML